MKSEPKVYSIDDLLRDRNTCWEGVRNYQARNIIRDQIKKNDLILFYHSNSSIIGVAGVARVCRSAYPDQTSFDPKSDYFDPKSSPDNPRWFQIDIQFMNKFSSIVTLEMVKQDPDLIGMGVRKKGNRLSVQPVTKTHFERILQLGTPKSVAKIGSQSTIKISQTWHRVTG